MDPRCSYKRLKDEKLNLDEMIIHGIDKQSRIPGKIFGVNLNMLMDTGADSSIIDEHFLKYNNKFGNAERYPPSYRAIVDASGREHPVLYSVILPLQLKVRKTKYYRTYDTQFQVVAGIQDDVLLGRDFVHANRTMINLPERYIGVAKMIKCKTNNLIVIPPQSEAVFPATLTDYVECKQVLVEPVTLLDRLGLMGARTICMNRKGQVMVRVINLTNSQVKLHKNTTIATAAEVTDDEINEVRQGEPTDKIRQNNSRVNSFNQPKKRQLMRKDRVREIIEDDLNKQSDLTVQQRHELLELVQKYNSVFAENFAQMGRSDKVQHVVRLKDPHQVPIKQRAYRYGPKQREFINESIDQMLEYDIIEPSYSSWSSPLVVVFKKCGKMRFCVDLRKVNQVCSQDVYGLPRIEDLIQDVGNKSPRYITCLDMFSGFWNIPIDEKSRELFAFGNFGRSYQFKVLPFGFMGAPSTMQRLVTGVMAGLKPGTASLYVDDLCIGSPTWEQHLIELELVFQAFQKANLTFNPQKCHFARREVTYLGFNINEEGIKPDPKNVEGIRNFPIPRRVRDVRSFLGSLNYYRKQIPGFSLLAKPLNRLLSKGVKFVWSEEHQVAFDALKEKLMTAPILAYPRSELPYTLITDASDYSIGYSLFQLQDGKERLIAANGKSLSKTQQNWSVHEREAYAVVMGLKFAHPLILGNKVLIKTDQASLKYILNMKEATGKIARWKAIISSYDYEIEHIKGVNNPADFLSRRHYDQIADESDSDINGLLDVRVIRKQNKAVLQNRAKLWLDESKKIPKLTDTRKDLIEAQKADPYLQVVRDYLLKQDLPTDNKLARDVQLQSNDFLLIEGVLHHISYLNGKGHKTNRTKLQLAVPSSYVFEVLKANHDSVLVGHPGIHNTIIMIKEHYYWKTLNSDVTNYVKSCQKCNAIKDPPAKLKQKMVVSEPVGLFHTVACDIIGPFPESERGYKYVLTMQDSFSSWTEAAPLRDQSAPEIAEAFFNNWICRFSCPKRLLSDRGASFTSALIRELSKFLGVLKIETTAYHPEGNSSLERFHHHLKGKLRMYISSSQKDWPDYLQPCMFATRIIPGETRRYSSYFILHGVDARFPLEQSLEVDTNTPITTQERLHDFADRIFNMRNEVSESIQKSKLDRKERLDARAKGKVFEVGDICWLNKPPTKGGSQKLKEHWFGPFRIIEKPSEVHAYLAWVNNNKLVPSMVHCSRLKPGTTRFVRPPNTVKNRCIGTPIPTDCIGSSSEDLILARQLRRELREKAKIKPHPSRKKKARASNSSDKSSGSDSDYYGDSESENAFPELAGIFLGNEFSANIGAPIGAPVGNVGVQDVHEEANIVAPEVNIVPEVELEIVVENPAEDSDSDPEPVPVPVPEPEPEIEVEDINLVPAEVPEEDIINDADNVPAEDIDNVPAEDIDNVPAEDIDNVPAEGVQVGILDEVPEQDLGVDDGHESPVHEDNEPEVPGEENKGADEGVDSPTASKPPELSPQDEEDRPDRSGDEEMPQLTPQRLGESVSESDTPLDIDPRRDIAPLLDIGAQSPESEARVTDKEPDPSTSVGGARPKESVEPRRNVATKYGFSPMKKGQTLDKWLRIQCEEKGLDKKTVKKEIKAETAALIEEGRKSQDEARRSQRIKAREKKGVNVRPWQISHTKKLRLKRLRSPRNVEFTALWSEWNDHIEKTGALYRGVRSVQ